MPYTITRKNIFDNVCPPDGSPILPSPASHIQNKLGKAFVGRIFLCRCILMNFTGSGGAGNAARRFSGLVGAGSGGAGDAARRFSGLIGATTTATITVVIIFRVL